MKAACQIEFLSATALCIDCDRCLAFPENAKKPDLIALWLGPMAAQPRWCVVEVKSKAHHARDIVAQLQAGADAIRDRPLFRFAARPTRLEPIVLHARGIKTAEASVIMSLRVHFDGKKIPIRVARSGLKLR